MAAGAGSGILVDDAGLGSAIGKSGSVIGGDENEGDGTGSDLGIGGEPLKEGSNGSDVNLVASTEEGSDVALVPSDSGISLDDAEDLELDDDSLNLVEIDSAELRLDDPAILHDSDDSVDLAIDPKEGSTGPGAKAEVDAAKAEAAGSGAESISSINLDDESSAGGSAASDLSFANLADDDSDDAMIGEDSDSLDVIADEELKLASGGASSLELMDDLDEPKSAPSGEDLLQSSGADVLSELDLLSAEQSGSGLISGDSESLLSSSGLGSSLSSGVLAEMDDALDSDDDLVIADDDADLMLDSVSDISVAGDSGINLMSPSDSGLSLESEPLDLAGSSISALDLGAELADGSDVGGSKISAAESGASGIDFQADEEFQLSPSGVGLDVDPDSSSQVIEVEDSDVAEAVVMDDDFGDGLPGTGAAAGAGAAAGGAVAAAVVDETPFGAGDPFADATPVAAADPMAAEAVPADPMDAGEAMMVEDTAVAPSPATIGGYEVPFTLFQCLALLFILLTLSLGGMLMTDLVRNMWAYSEGSAPVSSLTDALIGLMGWDT